MDTSNQGNHLQVQRAEVSTIGIAHSQEELLQLLSEQHVESGLPQEIQESHGYHIGIQWTLVGYHALKTSCVMSTF